MIEIPDHTVLRPIARGGYGEVWLAHNVTGTWRAVKFVRRDSFRDERPFDREFEGIRRYEPVSRSHEGLVDVLHVGRNDSDGWFYYVMELADDVASGRDIVPEHYIPRTLSAFMRREKRLEFSACLQLAQTLASALHYLHSEGLIHRDVKPSNIIYVHGVPMLADIGLVAEAGESRSFVGTEGFVPREGPGTAQADIFGLGKVLYQAVTGQDHAQFPKLPPDWNSLPDREDRLELNEIILRACEDDPSRRYQTAGDLLEHVRLLAGGKSVRHLRKLERSWRVARWFVGTAAVVVAMSMAVSLHFRRSAQREAALREQVETKLVEASIARARAARTSLSAGDRIAGLAAVRDGALVRPSRELRSHAISLLNQPDLQLSQNLAVENRASQFVYLDLPRRRYVEGPVDGRLVLRPVGERRVLQTLELPDAPNGQWRASFSPDGKWMSYSHTGRPLYIYELETGKRYGLGMPAASPGGFPPLSEFSADSRSIYWIEGSETVVVSPTVTGSPRRKIAIKGCDGHRVKPRPDGGAFLFRCTANHLHIVDATGAAISSFNPGGEAKDFIWTSDGAGIALVTFDGAIEFWDVRSATPRRLRRSESIDGTSLLNLCWVGGDDIIAATGWGGWTFLFSLPENRLLCRSATAGDDLVWAEGFLGVHDWGRQVFTTFECRRPDVVRSYIAPLRTFHSPAFSVDRKWLGMPAQNGVLLWRLPSKAGALPFVQATDSEVVSLDFGKPGSLSAYGVGNGSEWIFPGVGELLESPRDCPATYRGFTEFSRDRKRAVCYTNGGIALIQDGTQVRHWPLNSINGVPSNIATQNTISPDGRFAIAGPHNIGRWWLLDLEKSEPLMQRDADGGAGASFSPDGRYFAIGDGAEVSVYRTETRKRVFSSPRTPGIRIRTRPAWSLDGKRIVFSRSIDEFVVVETQSWTEEFSLYMPSGRAVSSPAFSPDGTHLIVSDSMNAVFVWDLGNISKELRTLGL